MDKYREQSLHCYPGTNVLKNKFDERDQDKLDNLETTFTTRRLFELYDSPIPGSFGLKHLQKIHKHIFQDVYPFAGKFRNESITKGNTRFAEPLFIESYGSDVMKELKGEKFLKGLDKEQFSERASYYLGEINMLHPFREGNGRTQREFFRTLAMKNGYQLDWSKIDQKTMLETSIKSVRESDAFKDLLMAAIENDEPNQQLIKKFNSLRKSNDLEL